MKNTAEDLSEIIATILPTLHAYVEQSMAGSGKVLKQQNASKLAKELNLLDWIKKGGVNPQNVHQFLDVYLENSQHMHHPGYIGHQVSSSHLASAVADFIHGVINNPMAIYEMGPSASVIEQTIVNWMLDKVGWFHGASIDQFEHLQNNGGGVLTHGGSMANLTALLSARAKAAPDAWTEGTPNNLVVMGSEVAHYSVARSISIMGLGKKNFIPIPTTSHEVMRPEHLESAYKKALDSDKKVMAVIANACATSTGLYDPLDEIGQFCNENGLWYHVDGAHGASALLSPDEKKLMKGVQRADSLIWDTHKMLRTSTLCAAVLFKDSKNLGTTFQQKGSYLFHDKEKPGFDFMAYALECTKAGLGTKLFWVLAAEGEEGIARYVERQYDITKEFYSIISDTEDFECPYFPESNILCFRYTKGSESNDFQLNLRNEIVKRGDFYITSTEIGGIRYMRFTVMNALTTTKHITDLLKEIRKIAIETS